MKILNKFFPGQIVVVETEYVDPGPWIAEQGWVDWLFRRPPQGILIEVLRPLDREVATKEVLFVEDLNPEINANGLYWRMTGIGREKWESIPSQVQE